MKLKNLTFLALFACVSASQAAVSNYFTDPSLDPDVQAANQSFLQGDFTGMAVHIKSALIAHPDNDGMKSNLLSLLSRAYQIGGTHAVSADWKLPSAFQYLTVSDRHTYNQASGKTCFSLSLYGAVQPGTEIEQLQLIQYSGKVVLDKQEGIGSYIDVPELDGTPSVGMYAHCGAEIPKGGLYFLNMKVKGNDLVQGWFLLTDDMASEETPTISSPQPSEVFETATPTFKWENFFSSQYQGFEDRRFFIGVTQDIPDAKQDIWQFYTRDPSAQTSIVLGSGKGTTGPSQIPNGMYLFNLSFREQRGFGDLTLTRYSQTKVPFTIDTAGSKK
jgi:hypothetical protein